MIQDFFLCFVKVVFLFFSFGLGSSGELIDRLGVKEYE